MLDRLMEMIIPADEHSPGAHTAKVNLFADLMVATGSAGVKRQWRRGLQLMREESAHSSLQEAMAKSAMHERNLKTDLERFFGQLKDNDRQWMLHIGDWHPSRLAISRQYLPRFIPRLCSWNTKVESVGQLSLMRDKTHRPS